MRKKSHFIPTERNEDSRIFRSKHCQYIRDLELNKSLLELYVSVFKNGMSPKINLGFKSNVHGEEDKSGIRDHRLVVCKFGLWL